MLKPVHSVACAPALSACQELMKTFSMWLCQPTTDALSITQANLSPPTMGSQIEANWLWDFLQRIESGKSLLNRAKAISRMSALDKSELSLWIQSVSNITSQFQANPCAWPVSKPDISKTLWSIYKELMISFYDKALRSGLPYQPDGTPITQGGVTYASFVQDFRMLHRLNPAPNAREVCVLCGGPLGQSPEVDHWVSKGVFPLLSICALNLLPICGECNSTANKGEKPVHTAGSFTDWYHPFLRNANSSIQLSYLLVGFTVTCSASNPLDSQKVNNLDNLLNLTSRWTIEFKAEYAKQQGILKRREKQRIRNNQPRHTQAEVQRFIQNQRNDLIDTEPNYTIHELLLSAMLEQARLASWQRELELI